MAYVTRAGKGSSLTATDHDANLLELQRQTGRDPVIIDNATTNPLVLTEAAHSNRELSIVRSTAIQLQVTTQALGGHPGGGKPIQFYGTNYGTGLVTFGVSGAATLDAGDSALPTSVAQNGVFNIIKSPTTGEVGALVGAERFLRTA
jgi:hypothetical protein